MAEENQIKIGALNKHNVSLSTRTENYDIPYIKEVIEDFDFIFLQGMCRNDKEFIENDIVSEQIFSKEVKIVSYVMKTATNPDKNNEENAFAYNPDIFENISSFTFNKFGENSEYRDFSRAVLFGFFKVYNSPLDHLCFIGLHTRPDKKTVEKDLKLLKSVIEYLSQGENVFELLTVYNAGKILSKIRKEKPIMDEDNIYENRSLIDKIHIFRDDEILNLTEKTVMFNAEEILLEKYYESYNILLEFYRESIKGYSYEQEIYDREETFFTFVENLKRKEINFVFGGDLNMDQKYFKYKNYKTIFKEEDGFRMASADVCTNKDNDKKYDRLFVFGENIRGVVEPYEYWTQDNFDIGNHIPIGLTVNPP